MNSARAAEILQRIGEARTRNFGVYVEMSTLTDAAAVGFVPRSGGSDATLKLIAAALRDAPERTRALLRQIAENDEEVVRLTEELSR